MWVAYVNKWRQVQHFVFKFVVHILDGFLNFNNFNVELDVVATNIP